MRSSPPKMSETASLKTFIAQQAQFELKTCDSIDKKKIGSENPFSFLLCFMGVTANTVKHVLREGVTRRYTVRCIQWRHFSLHSTMQVIVDQTVLICGLSLWFFHLSLADEGESTRFTGLSPSNALVCCDIFPAAEISRKPLLDCRLFGALDR